jgi:hypothetical protein
MNWIDRINQRETYLGAPDLLDGHSRVAEAMGGLADDECLSSDTLSVAPFASAFDDHDRVHEAMVGMCAADEL